MKEKKKKIGEILLENKCITKEMLNEALSHQSQFGGGITQYLLAHNYITEEELAKCISEQFGFPYLPLRLYNVPDEVIKLVPVDIAEKYWLVPIDKVKHILTVVMADPLDAEAIKEIETITGCGVQPFVGIFSDIIKAIEQYYKVSIMDAAMKKEKPAPMFIETETYKGLERRRAVRLDVKMDVHFPVQELYKKSRTKNLSLSGILFESANMLPIGSYLTLQMGLPKDYGPAPIAAVVQVARITPLVNKRFDIGVKIIKIPKEDLKALMAYARSQQE